MTEKNLLALVPAYDKDGINTTVAIYDDITAENLGVSIKTAISRIFREGLIEERLYKAWAKTVTKKKTGLAVVVDGTKLVGIKCREVRSRNDGCMLYLNRDLIYDIEDNAVYMKGLGKVRVQSKRRTIRDRIKDCDRIEDGLAAKRKKNA